MYEVGTLRYDKRQLRWLWFWLLLGDFCMVLIDVAVPKLLPLHLDAQGYDTSRIGWVISIGPLVALLLSPLIGTWSDRLRTRFGRRRPFLFVSTPLMGLSMILIPHVNHVALLVVLVVLIHLGWVFQNVVYYFYSDVIPSQLMGRFMGAFRVVGMIGTVTFLSVLLPQFDVAPGLVWHVVGATYLVLFPLTLWRVREGEYPPPEDLDLSQTVSTYVKDGFGSGYIWLLWGALCMTSFTAPVGAFLDLMAKNEIQLSMKEIGYLHTWATIISMVVAFPGGWMIDKIGPRLLWGGGGLAMAALYAWAFFFLHDKATMTVYYLLIGFIGGGIQYVTLMPMLYAHLPREKFGQLVSAQTLVVQAASFLGTNIGAQVVSASGNNYRLLFVYGLPFMLMIPIFTFALSKARNPFAHLTIVIKSDRDKRPADALAQGEIAGTPAVTEA